MKNSRVEWNDKPYTNKKHHLPSLFHGFSIWRYVLFDNNNNLMNFSHFERPIINKWLFDDIFFCGRLSMDICYIVLKDIWSVYDLNTSKLSTVNIFNLIHKIITSSQCHFQLLPRHFDSAVSFIPHFQFFYSCRKFMVTCFR